MTEIEIEIEISFTEHHDTFINIKWSLYCSEGLKKSALEAVSSQHGPYIDH